jgi:hypothetical protein
LLLYISPLLLFSPTPTPPDTRVFICSGYTGGRIVLEQAATIRTLTTLHS